jgi:hypothetical protein
MTTADIAELVQATAQSTAEKQPKAKAPLRLKPKRSPWTPKPRPASRDQLDGRLAAAKFFDRCVNDIISEMGGDISKVERGLVEGWVGAHVGLQGLIAKLCQGEQIDWSIYAGTLSVMVRTASKLQPWRRQRDITPSLSSYLASKEEEPC